MTSVSTVELFKINYYLDDSVSVVSVGDSLDPAVRKVDSVAAGGGVSVSLLSLGKVSSAVVIRDSVLVVVDWRLGQVTSNVAWSRLGMIDGGHGQGRGGSEESSS